MNAEGLLQHYERIADAPDAIGRLRHFILDLAVRGKLVSQHPSDEPATELFKHIQNERGVLLKVAAVKKPTYVHGVEADEAPFDLPATWMWVQLGDVTTKLTDGTHQSPPNAATGDFKYITAKNIKDDGVSLADVTYVAREVHNEIYSRCNPAKGDLLYIKDGATTGVVTINDLDEPFSMLSSVALLKFPRCVFNRLFVVFLRSPFFYDQMRAAMKGAAITRVTLRRMAPAVVPLPPLAEQHRIVAKVDELMALCDRLEAARTKREATRDRLTAASLARLNAPDPETFHEDARFALDVLPALTARSDRIKQLRQAILNLAVRGKLSPPGAWTDRLTPLAEVASLQNGYAFKSEWFSTSGIRLLRNANVSHETLDWSDVVYLPALRAAEFERFELRAGDVVLSLDRPFIGTGTKVARVSKGDLPALLLQRVGRFVLSAELHPDYLFMWIQSPHFSEQIDPGRSNGVPHISSKQVEQAVLRIPPIAEQRRIVTKVDGLMALCDRLETSLSSGADRRRRLLGALLHQALEPTVALEEAA